MARNKRRARDNRRKRREAFTTEQYDVRSLHEEREYGLFWYAWLWKLIRPVMVFLCSVLIVVGMVTVAWNWAYDEFLAPVDSMSAEVVSFEIEDGASVATIAQQLVDANLLRNADVFEYMVQFEGLTSSLSYGTYQLSPAMSVSAIIDELTSGSQTNERVITIIPGWTCEDIAEYLVGIGALEDTTEFLELCNDVDRFVGSSYALRAAYDAGTLEGRRYALEGYLAPDTYRVFLSATAESIINTLLEQNNNVYDDVFYTDTPDYYADEDGTIHEVETFQTTLTMDETIILASIIEKEAANSEDFARVSAVFHNRLRMGWRLESDPTATYLSGEDRLIVPEDEIADQNAYNTYYVTGLPVGPICNPSQAALEAALNPDLTYIEEGYLYFCAAEPTSGELVFARTLEEHEANVAQYRPLWEAYQAEQDAQAAAEAAEE